MNKKIIFLIYYLLWRGLVYFFTTKILKDFWFFQFILEYRWYLLFVTFSYIYYLFIYEDEEKKIQKKMLIIGNIYLFIFLFFRPLLWIEILPFFLLTLILFILRKSKVFPKKIQYIVLVIWCFFSLLLIWSGFFFTYPDPPDLQWFMDQQTTKLLINQDLNLKKTDAFVQLTNLNTHKKEKLYFDTQNPLSLWKMVEIYYYHVYESSTQHIFILFANWALLSLSPQSIVRIENNTLTLIQWKAWYHSSNLWWDQNLIWDFDSIDNETYETLTQDYRNDLKNYLLHQLWSYGLQDSKIQYLHKKFLTFLDLFFPKIFEKNLENKEMFDQYLDSEEVFIDLTPYTEKEASNSNEELRNYAKNNTLSKKDFYKIF